MFHGSFDGRKVMFHRSFHGSVQSSTEVKAMEVEHTLVEVDLSF